MDWICGISVLFSSSLSLPFLLQLEIIVSCLSVLLFSSWWFCSPSLFSITHFLFVFCCCVFFSLVFSCILAWEQFNDGSSLLREKNERWLPDWQTGRPSLIAPQKQQLIHTFTCCSPRSIHEKKYYYTFFILIQPISSYELNSFTAFITFHQQNKWVCYFYYYSMSAKTRESLKLIAIRLGKQNQFSFLFLVLLSSSHDSFKNI